MLAGGYIDRACSRQLARHPGFPGRLYQQIRLVAWAGAAVWGVWSDRAPVGPVVAPGPAGYTESASRLTDPGVSDDSGHPFIPTSPTDVRSSGRCWIL